ncbi:hypothetical protein MKX03_018551 [Papaver bracteatum]|nr:hypothetical protein MKX03_018551 [Papaver bracteatum]
MDTRSPLRKPIDLSESEDTRPPLRKFQRIKPIYLSESDDKRVYRARLLEKYRKIESSDLSESGEDKREEKRRYDQARLARRLKIEDKRRLLGVQSSEAASSHKKFWVATDPKLFLNEVLPVEDGRMQSGHVTCQLKLRMEKKDRVISLIDVAILQGGEETIVGSLEAHVNAFIYTASSFRQHFYFNNITKSFFRLGDERMPPLLHFQLHHPIMMGTEVTKVIEFRLVQSPLGEKRSDHDSDKIEKVKQIRDECCNKQLMNFVDKVDARWNFQRKEPFDELEKKYEFYGVLPSKASAAFALTLYNLIVLVETPVAVYLLSDIEFVNLAQLRPGEIDMTVIFQDFKEDKVLEINSIPLESLAGIKDRLNYLHVKYYVNSKKPEWKAILKNIAASPEEFIKNGGWDQYELEDGDTLAYYDTVALEYELMSKLR